MGNVIQILHGNYIPLNKIILKFVIFLDISLTIGEPLPEITGLVNEVVLSYCQHLIY